jgi:protein SCO1/2
VLADYMKAFGPSFVGLTGSVAAIKDVEKKYRVYAVKKPLEKGNYGVDHSSVLYLMGPDGKLVSFHDEAISPDDLAKELKQRL